VSVTPKRLYHDNPPNADTDLYTAPAGGAVVLMVLASNTTGGVLAVSLRIDPAGAGAAKDVLTQVNVPANDALRLAGPIALASGDKLVGRNHGGTGVALLISGFEIS
jgi:hypothetical protein